jgi:phosphohistidine phosphatase
MSEANQNPEFYLMKTLILVRHAKSSWDQPGLSDFDRPLNERGKKDAPEMAERLKEKGIKVDRFVSSPAKRAKRTARYFAEEFGVDKDDIKLVEDLYLATPEAFSSAILNLNDKDEAVALFAHNPGITEFASSLTNVKIDDMPTCAMFAVQAETDKWKEFEKAEKKFLFFDYPKNPIA